MGTLTDILGLYKPIAHESNYEDTLNPNWDTLDVLVGTPVANVKDPQFGALGDGVTDDTAAIRAAIAATRYYAIGPGFGGATIPNALKGSAGGVIFFPPGVYCISDTIEPDQRGATDTGSASLKSYSFIGAGNQSVRLKWIGASTAKPMLRLGADGSGHNAGASDNQGGVVRGIWFDGAGVAPTAIHLIECSSMIVEDNAFGGLRDYGILSEPDTPPSLDYGSIDLVIRRNYFGRGAIGGVGLSNGIGVLCKDAHALTIDNNEFGGDGCRHGNIRLQGGGGNMFRIINNSIEGMGQPAQTDAGGPYHSVHLHEVSLGLFAGNASEDVFTSAPDCRLLYLSGSTAAILITGNHLGVNPGNYAIEHDASHFEGLWMIGNPDLHGQVASVKIPAGFGTNIYAAHNVNWSMEAGYANDPDHRILLGPGYDHPGFDRLVVGDWLDVGVEPSLRAKFDLRGTMSTDSYIDGREMTAPPAPAANQGRLFYRDNGSGKTQLCVRFATGAIQVISTEP